jgi:hypothetical protein
MAMPRSAEIGLDMSRARSFADRVTGHEWACRDDRSGRDQCAPKLLADLHSPPATGTIQGA